MMRICALGILLLVAGRAQPTGDLQGMLNRVAEESEVFAYNARAVLSEEKLRQRTRKPAPRFRPRVGEPTQARKEEFLEREIVSEYGYSSFKDSPGALHEFRTVISVDGRKVQAPEKARRTLTLGVTSADDSLKKQLLKDFEKHGLVGATTDFGQLILLFSKRRLANYDFVIAGQDRIGADLAVVISFKQKGGQESLTVFSRNTAMRRTLEGSIWLRLPDYLPLRVKLLSSRKEDQFLVDTEATVDYTMSAHGCVLPAAVAHRETVGDKLITENLFVYAPFRKFGAASELKFDVP